MENVYSAYKGTGLYLDTGVGLKQVYRHRVTEERYYIETQEFMVMYNPILDSEVVTEEVAKGRYPEYFL